MVASLETLEHLTFLNHFIVEREAAAFLRRDTAGGKQCLGKQCQRSVLSPKQHRFSLLLFLFDFLKNNQIHVILSPSLAKESNR